MAKKEDTKDQGPTILTKMSIGTMGAPGKKLLGQSDDVKSLHVARIYGLAQGLKTKENKNTGDVYVSIIGSFEGINVETGEVFQSAVLYLPAGIHEMLEAPLRVKDAKPIEFALDIAAVRATNAAGYSYAAKPVIKPQQNDALSALRNALSDAPALPAPKA